jgi:hypothetical protein
LDLVMQEWQTVIGGALFLITIKALTLVVATRIPRQVEPNRLPTVDAIRMSILLAGGGEFAFVVLALAEKIEILPQDLISLLTAIVLVTMGVTPLLGDLAEASSKPFIGASSPYDETEASSNDGETNGEAKTNVAEDAIVILGHAEIGRAVLRMLVDVKATQEDTDTDTASAVNVIPDIVAFSKNPDLVDVVLTPAPGTIVLYGDGNNPEVIRSSGITKPQAIFVTYEEHSRSISATARLRAAFPDAPIYVRAAKRRESRNLYLAGATEVVVEGDELARAVPQLMRGAWEGPLNDSDYDSVEDYRVAASAAAGIPLAVVDDLFEVYESLDLCAAGLIGRDDVIEMFRKTKKGFIASDVEIKQMEGWLRTTTAAHMDPMDKIEFCRLYARAPPLVKESFGSLRNS